MVFDQEILGVIPARGGSKGIPGKNIKLLAGKPLIAWTIDSALKSKNLTRIIVSTDDNTICEISKKFGAEVPYLRPKELSTDTASSIDVTLHALDYLKTYDNFSPDFTILLQPTSPLRSSGDIDETISRAIKEGYGSIVSLTEARCLPNLVKSISIDGIIHDVYPQNFQYTRRQDFQQSYVLNGAIYLIRTDLLINTHSFLQPDSRAYIMPPERSIDIDTSWDFFLADLLLSHSVLHK